VSVLRRRSISVDSDHALQTYNRRNSPYSSSVKIDASVSGVRRKHYILCSIIRLREATCHTFGNKEAGKLTVSHIISERLEIAAQSITHSYRRCLALTSRIGLPDAAVRMLLTALGEKKTTISEKQLRVGGRRQRKQNYTAGKREPIL